MQKNVSKQDTIESFGTTLTNCIRMPDCIHSLPVQKSMAQFNIFIYVAASSSDFVNFTNFQSTLINFDHFHNSLPFLDLPVFISGDKHSTSSNPVSCKDAIPFSQFIFLRHPRSRDEAFHFMTFEAFSFFWKYGNASNVFDGAHIFLSSNSTPIAHTPVTFGSPSFKSPQSTHPSGISKIVLLKYSKQHLYMLDLLIQYNFKLW